MVYGGGFGGADSPSSSLSSRASGGAPRMVNSTIRTTHSQNHQDETASFVSSLASYASTNTGTLTYHRRGKRVKNGYFLSSSSSSSSCLPSPGLMVTTMMILFVVGLVQHAPTEQFEQELERLRSWASNTIAISTTTTISSDSSLTGNDAEDARYRSETNPINTDSMKEAIMAAAAARRTNDHDADLEQASAQQAEVTSSEVETVSAVRGGSAGKNSNVSKIIQKNNSKQQHRPSIETIHLSAALSKRTLQERAPKLRPVQIYTHYDGHPEHIAWTIVDAETNKKVVHRNVHAGEPEEVLFVVRLSPGLYYFEMTDSVGDGLCCSDPDHPDGQFAVTVTDEANVSTLEPLLQGADFGESTGKLYFQVHADGSGSTATAPKAQKKEIETYSQHHQYRS